MDGAPAKRSAGRVFSHEHFSMVRKFEVLLRVDGCMFVARLVRSERADLLMLILRSRLGDCSLVRSDPSHSTVGTDPLRGITVTWVTS